MLALALTGQIAWAVENSWFNTFVIDTITPDPRPVAWMVATSAVTATLTTLLMGTLSDLYEWQLYNAALVGMGWEGTCYLYNNPLETHGAIERRDWYEVPCCPSNLSRTWATLPEDVLDCDGNTVYVGQYISSKHHVWMDGGEIVLEMASSLPWAGEVHINIMTAPHRPVTLKLRLPSWNLAAKLRLNGEVLQAVDEALPETVSPQKASWLGLNRVWEPGDHIQLDFELPVRILHADHRVRSVQGKVALARGPLVYCLESCDNPEVDLFRAVLDPSSLQAEPSDLFGGIVIITGRTTHGEKLTFIPYHLWGNRGRSEMRVFVDTVS
ncbi:MAG: beta-L-arabinofuranosidase domain-containing protein [Brevefilum sp.]